MKDFKRILNKFINKLTTKYDLDMNLIEGINHKEFKISKNFYRPSPNSYHLYHVQPRNF